MRLCLGRKLDRDDLSFVVYRPRLKEWHPVRLFELLRGVYLLESGGIHA